MKIAARAFAALALAAVSATVACGKRPAPAVQPSPAAAHSAPARPAQPAMTWPEEQKLFNRIEAFLGNTRGAYVIPSRSVVKNFFAAVSYGGLSLEDPGPSGRLLWGARWHSADEKGAVLTTDDGQVEAVAILHYDCSGEARGLRGGDCLVDQPFVSVFLPRSRRAAELVRRMCDWGVARKDGASVICKTVWITSARPVRAGNGATQTDASASPDQARGNR